MMKKLSKTDKKPTFQTQFNKVKKHKDFLIRKSEEL